MKRGSPRSKARVRSRSGREPVARSHSIHAEVSTSTAAARYRAFRISERLPVQPDPRSRTARRRCSSRVTISSSARPRISRIVRAPVSLRARAIRRWSTATLVRFIHLFYTTTAVSATRPIALGGSLHECLTTACRRCPHFWTAFPRRLARAGVCTRRTNVAALTSVEKRPRCYDWCPPRGSEGTWQVSCGRARSRGARDRHRGGHPPAKPSTIRASGQVIVECLTRCSCGQRGMAHQPLVLAVAPAPAESGAAN